MSEITIERLGARGDGIGHDEKGKPVFVPFALPGERVAITQSGERGALTAVLSPSADRVEPVCPHFGECGGCTLQHMADGAYADWKRGLLVTALDHAGLSAEVSPLARTGTGQRRRAAFTFSKRKKLVTLGFNARATHRIVDLQQCPLLMPALTTLLGPLRTLLAGLAAEGGDVLLTATEGGVDVRLDIAGKLDLPLRERLAAFAEAQDLARLTWGAEDTVARRRPPQVRFGDVAVEVPPGGFLQPTHEGEDAIARLIAEGVGDAAPVLDLYAGCGSFSLRLAAGNRAVHAAEGDKAASAALAAAANKAGLSRVSVETRDLARRPFLDAELKRFGAVVFDPPRAGAITQAEQLAKSRVKRIVAVSCNPATLSRDLAVLVQAGFRLETVTPIDQFPWSSHLEAVAVLGR